MGVDYFLSHSQDILVSMPKVLAFREASDGCYTVRNFGTVFFYLIYFEGATMMRHEEN